MSKSRYWYVLFPGYGLADYYTFANEINEQEFRLHLKRSRCLKRLPRRLEVWPTTKAEREVIEQSQREYVETARKGNPTLIALDLMDQLTFTG